jgi:signal transduction histidine kinase
LDRTTQGILDVARGVLVELDIDVVLDRVLEAAQGLTEARYAALGVLSASKTELSRFLTRGIDEDTRAAIGPPPRGRGVLGALIEDSAPLRIGDVGDHPLCYGFPAAHPPMSSFLGVPIMVGGEPYGNLYLTEKARGEQFTAEDEQALVVLAEFAGVAVDHACRYTGASERTDELERTVATLEATTQIARALGGETDPEVVLELIAKRGRALVSARVLVIELVQGEELVVAAGAGELPKGLIGQRMATAHTLSEYAMRTRRAQRLDDELKRARFEEHGLGQFGLRASAGLAVPLVFRGATYGALVALDRRRDGPTFSAEDERLLEAFASSAATAVATARSVVAERQRQRLAAAEEERRRWARELHDETLQSLSALRIGLSSAARAERPQALPQAVSLAVEQLEDAIANLRALITDLRPAALDELGVQAAVEALVERISRHGIEVDVSIELAYEQGLEPTRPAPELEVALYRIVQEALNNAAKHANAGRAVVEIHEHGRLVHVSVRDDGAGFHPHDRGEGFGLLGMQERVALLDGELTIDSAPGSGTVVSARIPIRRRAAEPTPASPQLSLPAGGER